MEPSTLKAHDTRCLCFCLEQFSVSTVRASPASWLAVHSLPTPSSAQLQYKLGDANFLCLIEDFYPSGTRTRSKATCGTSYFCRCNSWSWASSCGYGAYHV